MKSRVDTVVGALGAGAVLGGVMAQEPTLISAGMGLLGWTWWTNPHWESQGQGRDAIKAPQAAAVGTWMDEARRRFYEAYTGLPEDIVPALREFEERVEWVLLQGKEDEAFVDPKGPGGGCETCRRGIKAVQVKRFSSSVLFECRACKTKTWVAPVAQPGRYRCSECEKLLAAKPASGMCEMCERRSHAYRGARGCKGCKQTFGISLNGEGFCRECAGSRKRAKESAERRETLVLMAQDIMREVYAERDGGARRGLPHSIADTDVVVKLLRQGWGRTQVVDYLVGLKVEARYVGETAGYPPLSKNELREQAGFPPT